MVITNPGATEIVNDCGAVCCLGFPLSATLIANEKGLPVAVVGVPDNPPLELSFMPGGNVPDAREKT